VAGEKGVREMENEGRIKVGKKENNNRHKKIEEEKK
jgi:hypothetical protein